MTPDLLNFQRMGQAAAHRGIFLQRENLGFLLQPADRRRVDNAPTVAFKLAYHVIFITRLNRRTERTLEIEFVLKIDPGYVPYPFQPPRHSSGFPPATQRMITC